MPVEQSQVRRWEVRWYVVAQSRLQVIVRRWANVVCAFRRRDDPLYGAHPRMRPNMRVMFMRLLECLNIGSMETLELVPEPLPEGLTAPGGGASSWLNPFAFYKHMGETWLQEWVQCEGGPVILSELYPGEHIPADNEAPFGL